MQSILQLLMLEPELAKKYLVSLKVKANRKVHEYLHSRDKQKVLIVKKGIVKVEVWYEGNWRLSSFYGPDGIIGMSSFVKQLPYVEEMQHYRVIGLSDGEIVSVEADFFIDHLYAHPHFFQEILEAVTLRFLVSQFIYRERRVALSKRLATGIIAMMNMTNMKVIGGRAEFVPAFTKRLIASFIQAHPYRLNHVFKNWEEAGLIAFDTHLIVFDIKQLEKETYLRFSSENL